MKAYDIKYEIHGEERTTTVHAVSAMTARTILATSFKILECEPNKDLLEEVQEILQDTVREAEGYDNLRDREKDLKKKIKDERDEEKVRELLKEYYKVRKKLKDIDDELSNYK